MSTEQQRIKELEEQLAAAKAAISSKHDTLTVKIGEKGNVVIYGLGRFPMSFYTSQLDKLIPLFNSETFQKFLADNASKLAKKG